MVASVEMMKSVIRTQLIMGRKCLQSMSKKKRDFEGMECSHCRAFRRLRRWNCGDRLVRIPSRRITPLRTRSSCVSGHITSTSSLILPSTVPPLRESWSSTRRIKNSYQRKLRIHRQSSCLAGRQALGAVKLCMGSSNRIELCCRGAPIITIGKTLYTA